MSDKPKTLDQCIVWASGIYLTEYLPDNHDDMGEKEVFEFITDHQCEFNENDAPQYTWEQIDDLARAVFRDFVEVKECTS